MKNLKDLIDEFALRAIKYREYGYNGDYKRVNSEMKKINKLFENIKKQRGQEELLELIYSDNPAIASQAAIFSLRYNPEKSLNILRELAEANIPHISTGAKYAIQNWNNGQWYID